MMTTTILPAGIYTVTCLDDMNSIFHTSADTDTCFKLPRVQEGGMTAFEDRNGKPTLLVDAGMDAYGQANRAIPFAGKSLLLSSVFEDGPAYLVIRCIDIDDYGANPCAPDCVDAVKIRFESDTVVTLVGRMLTIGDHVLDLARPGVFTKGDEIVDMADAGNAARYGYADAETDEHGIHWWDENASEGVYLYFGGKPHGADEAVCAYVKGPVIEESYVTEEDPTFIGHLI